MASPWLTAAELAAYGLPADIWPGSEFRSRAKLHKLAVPSRLREGSKGGGGREYDTAMLPPDVRRALLQRQLAQAPDLLPAVSPDLAAPPVQPPASTAAAAAPPTRKPPSRLEAACADGRLALVNHLRTLAADGGMTRAAEELSRQLHAGQAPEHLLQSAADANQRPRNPAHAGLAEGGVTISVRTLFRWVGDHRKGGWWALCPTSAKSTALANVDGDVAAVLKRYSSASGAARNLTQVVRDVTASLGRPFDDWAQLYGRARRALPKMNRTALIKARHKGAERSARLPFNRRLTDNLRINDVWVIDGHTFKAKVRHPIHGRPFAPEVTVVMDAGDRYITGWSASLSEDVRGVAACLRHAFEDEGVPGIVYGDNGPGQTGKQLDAPVAGIYGRMGIDHRTGLPGLPQGHGIVERIWQMSMIECARQFDTYQGGDADSRSVRDMRLSIEKESRALERARETGDVVKLARGIPPWDVFLAAVGKAVRLYNQEHRHSSLPRHEGGDLDRKRMTPAEARNTWRDPEHIVKLSPADVLMLTLPAVVRKAVRGEVEFLSRFYFNRDLMQVDGERVRVDYDLNNAERVWVWTLKGEFVCEALETRQPGSNGQAFFPDNALHQARYRRAEAAIKLREGQAELARRELNLTLPSSQTEFVIPGVLPAADAGKGKSLEFVERVPPAPPAAAFDPAARPLAFDTASDRYEWLMQHAPAGGHAADDTAWLAAYAAGPEYAGLRDYYASRGIAWPDDDAAFKSAG